MHRLAVSLSAFALILAMLVNGALFYQNTQLRKQVSAAAARPHASQPDPDQAARIAALEQQLARSEQDRIKATRDATAARGQLGPLQDAARERDALKGRVQALEHENQQLRSEVGNLQTMNTINGQVAPLRGLLPTGSVPRSFMDHDQLRAYFTAELETQWSPEDELRAQAVLRALDMGDGGAELRQAQIDDAVESVLGFYDHETKQLVVVTDRAQMGVLDRVTYAHEFTHSLQDQHYDLAKLFEPTGGNSDAQMALKGLVEGDATLTMGLYAREHFTAADIANYQLEQFQSIDLSGLRFGSGGPMVESAAYFPYREGASFVATLYQLGGWEGIDAAYRNPPRSTEQVLHPERYYGGDEPVAVSLPALNLGGWRTLAEDTLGELYLRIYLEHRLPFEQAIPACEDWGGDRYQVLADDQGRLALVLQTAWDSQAAARRFFDAAGSYVAAAGGAPIAFEQSRSRWQLPGRQFYLSRVADQVLLLHAPDAATLDALVGRFQGF
jgi:hypothetical protein